MKSFDIKINVFLFGVKRRLSLGNFTERKSEREEIFYMSEKYKSRLIISSSHTRSVHRYVMIDSESK